MDEDGKCQVLGAPLSKVNSEIVSSGNQTTAFMPVSLSSRAELLAELAS